MLHVNEQTAPTLLIHGDKDELVPLEHSNNLVTELKKTKVPHRLLVIEGAGHGFSKEQTLKVVYPAMVGWFETHLLKSESK